MKRKTYRRIAALVLTLLMALSFSTNAFAYPAEHKDSVARSGSITPEEFNQFISTLETHVGDVSSWQGFDTGIANGSDTNEFNRKKATLTALFGGGFNMSVLAVQKPTSNSRLTSVEPAVNGKYFIYHSYREGGTATYKVAWIPNTDARGALDRHYAAWNILSEIAAGAPADDVEAYRYFNDQLCARLSYGKGVPEYYTPYGALTGGIASCEAYSACFLALCFMTGRDCYMVFASNHVRNMVYVNGVPKWIDVTWNDGSGNRYFLIDVDQAGLDYINVPGTNYAFQQ